MNTKKEKGLMTFEELKKQTLELIKEVRSHPFVLPQNHPLNEKKNNLKHQYIPNVDHDEYELRLFQLKGLGFLGNIDQIAYRKQTEEEYIKLFDDLQKITKEDIQKMADDRKEEDEKRNANIKKWKEKKALIKQPKTLTISERSVNYLYGQSKIKGVGRIGSRGRKLNHKLMWVVDFLSSRISKECGFDKGKKSEVVLFENIAAFNSVVGDIKEGNISQKEASFEFKFTASEVREWWGFTSNQMSIKEVVGLFKKLQEVIFEAEGEPILRDVEKNEWSRRKVSDPLYSLDQEIIGVISNRWKTKEVILTLRMGGMNIMSWIFLSNLSTGRKGRITLPKNAIHQLDGYGQNIFRWLRLWKKPRKINVMDLAGIAGLKNKEVDKLIISLKRILNNLKEKRYIKDWKATGKGHTTQYAIIKGVEALKGFSQDPKRPDTGF